MPKLAVTPPYTPRISSYSFYSPPYSIPSSQNSSPESPPPFISGRGIDTESSGDDDGVIDESKMFDSRVLERGVGEGARISIAGDSIVREEMDLTGIERLTLLASPITTPQRNSPFFSTILFNSEDSSPWEEKSENEISNSIIERFPLPKLYPNSTLFTPPRYPPSNTNGQGEGNDSPYRAPSPYSSAFYQRLFSDPTTILQTPSTNQLLPSVMFDTPPPLHPPFNSPQSLDRSDSEYRFPTTRVISTSTMTSTSSSRFSAEISPDHSHNVGNHYAPFRHTTNNKKGSLVIGSMNEVESIQAYDGDETFAEGEGSREQKGNEVETRESSEELERNQTLLEAMSPLSRCFRRDSLKPEDNSEEDDKKDNRRNMSRRVPSDHSTFSSSSSSENQSTPSDSGSVIELDTQEIKLRRLTRKTQELETKLVRAEKQIEEMKLERASEALRITLSADVQAIEGLGMEMGDEKVDEKSLEVVLAKMGVDIVSKVFSNRIRIIN